MDTSPSNNQSEISATSVRSNRESELEQFGKLLDAFFANLAL